RGPRYGHRMLARAWGIARSLVIYHGQPAKHRRALRLYGEFLGPGDLAFDIGAHVGGRVRTWRRLGARVVAVEPQPDCLRVLRLLFGRDRQVRSEEHTSELQSRENLVCRLLLEKIKTINT